jgi:low affinity Fe/Cu permease
MTNLSGRPIGFVLALAAAAAWALGTQLMRKTTMPAAALTISF